MCTLRALHSVALDPGWNEESVRRALRLHRPSLGLLTAPPPMENQGSGKFGSILPQVPNSRLRKDGLCESTHGL